MGPKFGSRDVPCGSNVLFLYLSCTFQVGHSLHLCLQFHLRNDLLALSSVSLPSALQRLITSSPGPIISPSAFSSPSLASDPRAHSIWWFPLLVFMLLMRPSLIPLILLNLSRHIQMLIKHLLIEYNS